MTHLAVLLQVDCTVVSQRSKTICPVLVGLLLWQVLNKMPLLHSVIDRAIARSSTAWAPPRNSPPFPTTVAAPSALASDVVIPV